MDSQPRDEFRDELERRGLPRAYIERLLSELDDHFTDLLEERNTSMNAARKLNPERDDLQQRLGSPTQLAIFASEQYHARTFWGRHPIITFLVGPLPLVLACWLAFSLALSATILGISYLSGNVLGWSIEPHEHPWLQAIGVALASWYVRVFPPLAAAWLLCRVAHRNGLDWRWPALACSHLAVVAAVFTVSYRLATEPNNGLLVIGFDVGTSPRWLLLTFLPKFAIALGIGLLLVKRAQRQVEIAA